MLDRVACPESVGHWMDQQDELIALKDRNPELEARMYLVTALLHDSMSSLNWRIVYRYQQHADKWRWRRPRVRLCCTSTIRTDCLVGTTQCARSSAEPFPPRTRIGRPKSHLVPHCADCRRSKRQRLCYVRCRRSVQSQPSICGCKSLGLNPQRIFSDAGIRCKSSTR